VGDALDYTRSPFTVHRSPFTVHRSPFTVHRSPFTGKWATPLLLDFKNMRDTLFTATLKHTNAERRTPNVER
jgi:hypothetical protein